MRRLVLFSVGMLVIALSACKKPIIDGYELPDPLTFVLLDKQGHNLITSLNSSLKIWSFTPQGKQFYLDYTGKDFQPIAAADSTVSFPYKFLYNNAELGVESSLGSKEWYLELNNKVDTLHYDVQHTRPNDRFHQYDVLSVRFNGKPIAPIMTPGVVPYYVFQRQR